MMLRSGRLLLRTAVFYLFSYLFIYLYIALRCVANHQRICTVSRKVLGKLTDYSNSFFRNFSSNATAQELLISVRVSAKLTQKRLHV